MREQHMTPLMQAGMRHPGTPGNAISYDKHLGINNFYARDACKGLYKCSAAALVVASFLLWGLRVLMLVGKKTPYHSNFGGPWFPKLSIWVRCIQEHGHSLKCFSQWRFLRCKPQRISPG